ncbi:DUF397 domain-containing protein [Streptomyces sp. NPDC057499]|uniref:DUF397 domain-containing protein n=1 Tax=Streptomyces sp. NPDC057499 TaxID=3346150 RepID=UPI003689F942
MVNGKPLIAGSSAIALWRKSSYSGGSQGDCLEVADGHTSIPVRDSKNPTGPAILFPARGWSEFVAAVRNGSLTA